VVSLVTLAPYAGIDIEEAIRSKRIKSTRAMKSVMDILVPILATASFHGKTVVVLIQSRQIFAFLEMAFQHLLISSLLDSD